MQFVTYVPTDSFGVLRLHAWVITQSRKSGFAPLLELHGGGWLGMSAADTSEKDKIGLTKWRVVPEQDRRLVRAGFVTSQVHAECSVPGASFRPVETTH